jgi:diaminopimelate epimerase
MQFNFFKFEGAGNDFILLDDRLCSFPADQELLIQSLCHRQKGIGADGLILLQESNSADFRMRIFNSANGKEAAMCGNGLRCLIAFLCKLGMPEKEYRIETLAGILSAGFKNEQIFFSYPRPKIIRKSLQNVSLLLLDVGVPHAVLFVDQVEEMDVTKIGREISLHSYFSASNGVNVNFAQLEAPNRVLARTYERGVEAETLACGTGAAAIALAAHEEYGLSNKIKIIPKSQEEIEVEISDLLEVAGPATFVYEGTINTLLMEKLYQ